MQRATLQPQTAGPGHPSQTPSKLTQCSTHRVASAEPVSEAGMTGAHEATIRHTAHPTAEQEQQDTEQVVALPDQAGD